MASFSPGIAVHSLTGLAIHTPGSCLLNCSLQDFLVGWLNFLLVGVFYYLSLFLI